MPENPKIALSIEQPSAMRQVPEQPLDPMPPSAGVVSGLGVVITRAATDAGKLDKTFAIASHHHGEQAVEDVPA